MSSTTLFWLQYGPMAVGGVLALVADAVGAKRYAVWAAALGVLMGGAVGIWGGWWGESATVFEAFFVGAAFSTLTGVIGVLTAASILGGSTALLARPHGGALASLLALAALAAGLTVSSADLVALLLSIETAALASYALVSAARSRRADEAAMKYYIQGAVSTGLLILGVTVLVALYAPDGRYATLAGALAGLEPTQLAPGLFGVLLLATAFAFKSGAVPFHSWAPDAYENAPAEASAFMAGPLKLAFLFAGVMLVVTTALGGRSIERPLGGIGADLLPILGVLGVLSILVGSVAALRQRSYTRMLGYAGVAQVGYGLIATAAPSTIAVAVFATTYAIAVTGAFLAALAVMACRPGWDGSIDGLAGLGRRSPLIGVSLSMLMISLAGLPPFVGFWGKFEVFVAAIGSAQQYSLAGSPSLGYLYAAFAIVGLAGSVISLAYYGRVVRILFAEDCTGEGDAAEKSDRSAETALIALACLALILGLAPVLTGLSAPMQGFLLR